MTLFSYFFLLDSERPGASPSSDVSIKSSSSGNRTMTFGEHIDQIISNDYKDKGPCFRDNAQNGDARKSRNCLLPHSVFKNPEEHVKSLVFPSFLEQRYLPLNRAPVTP